jgi:hypothetical protein
MLAYGHNDQVDQDGFWKAYVNVKGMTEGHKVPSPIPPLHET